MNLLYGLLVVLCLSFIAIAEGNRLRRKQNSPLARLQRFSPSIFGRSELSDEEVTEMYPTSFTSPVTDGAATTAKSASESTSESTTKIPKHEDNVGIAKYLDSLNFDYVDKAIENLNIPDFKK